MKLTTLSPKQAEYLGVSVDGPYKAEHYRYLRDEFKQIRRAVEEIPRRLFYCGGVLRMDFLNREG